MATEVRHRCQSPLSTSPTRNRADGQAQSRGMIKRDRPLMGIRFHPAPRVAYRTPLSRNRLPKKWPSHPWRRHRRMRRQSGQLIRNHSGTHRQERRCRHRPVPFRRRVGGLHRVCRRGRPFQAVCRPRPTGSSIGQRPRSRRLPRCPQRSNQYRRTGYHRRSMRRGWWIGESLRRNRVGAAPCTEQRADT
jgi:hypothetical protein